MLNRDENPRSNAVQEEFEICAAGGMARPLNMTLRGSVGSGEKS
jgi:hypothetical protein